MRTTAMVNVSPTPTRLSPRFTEAFAWAAELHRDQLRKGTPVPYISHLMAVAALVLEHGGGEDEAIAALLHDAIEDQGGDAVRQEIVRRFGRRVADIVDGCTDAETIPKPPWRARKERYLAHLRHADASVRLVSAADKVHNARAVLQDYRRIGETLWGRFTGGRDGTLWYYRALADAFRALDPRELAEELERAVAELERLADAVSPSGPDESFVEFHPAAARPGAAATARAGPFPAGKLVDLVWVTPQGQRLVIASRSAFDNGIALIPFVVPFDGGEGERIVEICCPGESTSVRGAFTVAGSPPEITAP
jgi:hypothetical protein